MKHLAISLLAAFLTCTAIATPLLELKKGDHICIIGNSLAERMQHDGWLETLIHARFPKHELVFRNLGFPATKWPALPSTPMPISACGRSGSARPTSGSPAPRRSRSRTNS